MKIIRSLVCDLTEKSVGDTTALAGLLGPVEGFKTFMGDSSYDSASVYQQIIVKQPDADIVIPPTKNAVPNASDHGIRNQHVDIINEQGRMTWQQKAQYRLWALVELVMLRYKTILTRS
jgi:hypothetical protein